MATGSDRPPASADPKGARSARREKEPSSKGAEASALHPCCASAAGSLGFLGLPGSLQVVALAFPVVRNMRARFRTFAACSCRRAQLSSSPSTSCRSSLPSRALSPLGWRLRKAASCSAGVRGPSAPPWRPCRSGAGAGLDDPSAASPSRRPAGCRRMGLAVLSTIVLMGDRGAANTATATTRSEATERFS